MLLANSWMSSWPGTSLSPCHQASMSNCYAHQWIHSAPIWGEGSGVRVSWRLSPTPTSSKGISYPPKNSSMQGLGVGGHSRSSSSGLASDLDQSDGLSVPSLSSQVGRVSLALASSLGLSSKVTHYLDCTGVGTSLTFWLVPLDVMPPGGPWSVGSLSGIFADGCPSACSFLSISNQS